MSIISLPEHKQANRIDETRKRKLETASTSDTEKAAELLLQVRSSTSQSSANKNIKIDVDSLTMSSPMTSQDPALQWANANFLSTHLPSSDNYLTLLLNNEKKIKVPKLLVSNIDFFQKRDQFNQAKLINTDTINLTDYSVNSMSHYLNFLLSSNPCFEAAVTDQSPEELNINEMIAIANFFCDEDYISSIIKDIQTNYSKLTVVDRLNFLTEISCTDEILTKCYETLLGKEKKLSLSTVKNLKLSLLPESIKKITFTTIDKETLSQLPSSVLLVAFNTQPNGEILSQLPESVIVVEFFTQPTAETLSQLPPSVMSVAFNTQPNGATLSQLPESVNRVSFLKAVDTTIVNLLPETVTTINFYIVDETTLSNLKKSIKTVAFYNEVNGPTISQLPKTITKVIFKKNTNETILNFVPVSVAAVEINGKFFFMT